MSAPTQTAETTVFAAVAEERRPVSTTLPPSNGRGAYAGVGLIPANITAAFAVGSLINTLAPGYGFEFAIGCLVLVGVVAVLFVIHRSLGGLD